MCLKSEILYSWNCFLSSTFSWVLSFFLFHIQISFFLTTKNYYFHFQMLDKLFYADKITRSSTLRKVEWLKVLEKPIQTHSSKGGSSRQGFKVPFSHSDGKTWMYGILLLWGNFDLVIKKDFWNSRLKAKNLEIFYLFEQWN